MKLNIDPKLLFSQAVDPANESKQLNRNNSAELKKSCQEFEAIFIRTLIKSMRATVPDGGLLEKNTDREIFEEMMDNEIASQTAKRGEFGIADVLFRQLYQNKESDNSD
jgi:flagellar protein FlgJ